MLCLKRHQGLKINGLTCYICKNVNMQNIEQKIPQKDSISKKGNRSMDELIYKD